MWGRIAYAHMKGQANMQCALNNHTIVNKLKHLNKEFNV